MFSCDNWGALSFTSTCYRLKVREVYQFEVGGVTVQAGSKLGIVISTMYWLLVSLGELLALLERLMTL